MAFNQNHLDRPKQMQGPIPQPRPSTFKNAKKKKMQKKKKKATASLYWAVPGAVGRGRLLRSLLGVTSLPAPRLRFGRAPSLRAGGPPRALGSAALWAPFKAGGGIPGPA